MTQPRALEIMLSGRNVFLTGAPGSGKTYLVNSFIEELKKNKKNVAITASTGVAATHIGGQTIHSWSGYGYGAQTKPGIDQTAVKAAQVLIIDEISMIGPDDFDRIDKIIRKVRNSQKSFGGIQIILVGDLFQLPPINKSSQRIRFFNQSKVFAELDLMVCYLTDQYRQKLDDALLRILISIRQKSINSRLLKLLDLKTIYSPSLDLISLHSHNYDVNKINFVLNQRLKTGWLKYEISYRGDKRLIDKYRENVISPDVLILKKGSRVMFNVNSPEKGYVNGTTGLVVGFRSFRPIIRTDDMKYIVVDWHEWNFQDKLFIKQLPLKLAFAVSIHKSQGMTLQKAIIDLSNAFTPGMGYVALSRLGSLEGLYLKGINNMALKINDEAYLLEEELIRLSSKNE